MGQPIISPLGKNFAFPFGSCSSSSSSSPFFALDFRPLDIGPWILLDFRHYLIIPLPLSLPSAISSCVGASKPHCTRQSRERQRRAIPQPRAAPWVSMPKKFLRPVRPRYPYSKNSVMCPGNIKCRREPFLDFLRTWRIAWQHRRERFPFSWGRMPIARPTFG